MKRLLFCFYFFNFYTYCQQPTEELEAIFNHVFQVNGFHGTESISGPGASLEQTTYIRTVIPKFLVKYNIKSLFDAPCGDFNWMKEVDLPIDLYIGADIVKALIDKNNRLYANKKRMFLHLNLVADDLPTIDLILCRDLLVHFSYENIQKFFYNIKKSSSTYILMTHFPGATNENVRGPMDWRPLDFEAIPFNFPTPLEIIKELDAPVGWKHKSLALWKISDIPDFSLLISNAQ